MYRAFNLTACDWSNTPLDRGDTIFKRDRTKVKSSLESVLTNGIVDGSKLSTQWFPQIRADVFISHSHADQEDAIKCAGWLKENFGIEAFIDSCVWGHADDLLKTIDLTYCLNSGGKTFDYDKRNRSTSHVHMILANALSEMIDSCECILFLNSPNSITSANVVEKTQSPWLFLELGLMRTIRRNVPERHKKLDIFENFSSGVAKRAELKVEYSVPLKTLTNITCANLKSWSKIYAGSEQGSMAALDTLYRLNPENGIQLES